MFPKFSKEKTREILASFNDIYIKYKPKLTLYAFFKTNNKETSEDIVQDTFLKTWIYFLKNGKIDIIKAFLYRIIKNLIIDEYRKKKAVSLDRMMDEGFDTSGGDSYSINGTGGKNNTDTSMMTSIIDPYGPEAIFRELDHKRALELIKNLPEKYRQVMHLRYVELLSVEEISTSLGQTKNTTSVHIHRGLLELRQLMEGPAIQKPAVEGPAKESGKGHSSEKLMT